MTATSLAVTVCDTWQEISRSRRGSGKALLWVRYSAVYMYSLTYPPNSLHCSSCRKERRDSSFQTACQGLGNQHRALVWLEGWECVLFPPGFGLRGCQVLQWKQLVGSQRCGFGVEVSRAEASETEVRSHGFEHNVIATPS